MNAGFSITWLVIVIVIWVLSAIFKKKEEPEQTELPPELKPRRDRPQPPTVARSWEEELRRVLEQGSAPPPIVQEVPQRHRPRLVVPPPPPMEPHIEVSLPPPHPNVEPIFQKLPGLTESTQRYAEAMTLEQRVTKHMGDVTSHPVGTTSVVRREMAPELRDAITAMRSRTGARSAILASIILGPPRAFEV